MSVLAPAKINLVLEVLGIRDDGYHEICSVIQTVDLCDKLSFNLADEIQFKCSEPSLQNRDNLVVKAAESLQRACGCVKGASIELEKRIPWSAGLGGGSSDAAATLLTLNKLWQLKLSISELFIIAAKLGSDIPFFFYQGTALVERRGDRVIPVSQLLSCWFVLCIPPVLCPPQKTAALYSRLRDNNYTDGKRVQNALERLFRNASLSDIPLFNVFDEVALGAYAGLDKYWELFIQAGAGDVHLAGSGPALFALAPSESIANEWSGNLQQHGLKAYVVSTFESKVI